MAGLTTIAAAMLLALQTAPAAPPPQQAAPQQDAAEQAREARLLEAIRAMNRHDNAAANAILDPLLADYERLYAGEKKAIFCAEDTAQSLIYLTGAVAAMDKGKAANRGAIAISIGWCTALWAKGYALNDVNRFEEAIPFLKRATEMAPLDAHALSELGHSYQSLRRSAEALDAFTRAADAAGRYEGDRRVKELGRAWRGMGYNLAELGRWDEAAAIYRKCVDLNPQDKAAAGEIEWIAQNRPRK